MALPDSITLQVRVTQPIAGEITVRIPLRRVLTQVAIETAVFAWGNVSGVTGAARHGIPMHAALSGETLAARNAFIALNPDQSGTVPTLTVEIDATTSTPLPVSTEPSADARQVRIIPCLQELAEDFERRAKAVRGKIGICSREDLAKAYDVCAEALRAKIDSSSNDEALAPTGARKTQPGSVNL